MALVSRLPMEEHCSVSASGRSGTVDRETESSLMHIYSICASPVGSFQEREHTWTELKWLFRDSLIHS